MLESTPDARPLSNPEPTSPAPNRQLLLWLVAFGFFMETLDSTIVNTALPSMAKSLGESPLAMYSVVIGYSLTIALLIPASGWIADRFGIRRTFFTAIVLFSLGSILCASSQNLFQLVLSRVLQGTGGAMLLPVGRLAVLRAFPQEEFLAAISFVAVPGLIGPLIGPTLGGTLVQFATWHWIFLINVPVGLVGCFATLRYMPDLPPLPRRSFDMRGFIMLALSMVSISLALDGLSELGLPHATVLVLLMLGLAALASYWLHAARSPSPLFSLKLFEIRTFSIGLLGNLFARIGSSGMPFLIPLMLQLSLGYTPLEAGLSMLPVAIAGIGVKRLATPLISHFGYRRFLVMNTVLVGLMIASFTFISADQWLVVRIVQLFIFGGVNSLQFSAMNSITLKDLASSGASSGNSLFSMVQMLALSFGVATAGAALSTFTERFGTSPEGVLRAFHWTFVSVGLITCTSAWIFWQLQPELNRVRTSGHVNVG